MPHKRLIQIFFFFLLFVGGAFPASAAKDYNIKSDTESFLFVSGTSGNVGIATTAPVGKLEVRGGTSASSRIVNINGSFADLGGSRTGLYVDVTAPVAGAFGATGTWSQVRTTAGAGMTYSSAITGAYTEAMHEGASTVLDLMGLMTLANQLNAGPVTNAYGVFPQVWKGTGTITNAYGMYFQGVPDANGDTGLTTGTLLNQYGLGIGHLTTGTTRNIALLLDDDTFGSAITGDFGILQEDTAPNAFGGNIGVGTTEVDAQLTLHSTGDPLIDKHWNEDTTAAAANESHYMVGQAGSNRATPGDVQKFRFFAGYGAFQEVGQIAVHTPTVTGGSMIGAVDIMTRGADGFLTQRIAIDEEKLMIAPNVGIGTSEPEVKLHVGDTGSGPDVMSITGSDAYIEGNLEVDGRIYGDGSGLTGISGAIVGLTATHVPVASGPATIVDSGIYYVGSNVGIGTSAPMKQLDVLGELRVSSAIASSGGGIFTNAGGVFSNSNAPVNWGNINTSSNSALALFTRNVEAMRLDPNGNIGISTTAPASKLDVVGAAHILSDAGTANIGYATTPGSLYIQQDLEVDGNVYLGDLITDSLIVAGSLTLAGSTNYAGPVSISTTDTTAFVVRQQAGGTQVFNVDTVTGNVGISSATPGQALDVAGTIRGSQIIDSGLTAGRITYAGTAGQLTDSANLVFNGTNVGIGSTDPSATLVVDGGNTTVGFFKNTQSLFIHQFNASGYQMLNSAGGYGFTLTPNVNRITSNGGVARSFYLADSGGDRLTIEPINGNVGLGMTAPVAKLHIGDAGSTPNIMNITGNDAYIKGNLEVDGTIYSTLFLGQLELGMTTGSVVFEGPTGMTEDNANFFWDDTNNRLGIGTTVPASKLDLNINDLLLDGIRINEPSTGGYISFGEGTLNAGQFQPHINGHPVNSSRTTYWGSNIRIADDVGTMPVMSYFSYREDGSSIVTRPLFGWGTLSGYSAVWKMVMDQQGNVGIGTASPSARLDLIGIGTTSATSALIIRDSSNAAKVTVLDNGNVGFGISTPSAQVEVASDASMSRGRGFTAAQYSNNNWGTGYVVRKARGTIGSPLIAVDGDFVGGVGSEVWDGAKWLATAGFGFQVSGAPALDSVPQDFYIRVGNTEDWNRKDFVIKSSGNVGIGTASPLAKLVVDGNIYFTSSGTTISTSATELILEQRGDTLGTTRLRLQSRNGSSGALFENLGLDLVDFGFKPNVGGQHNFRLEHRATNVLTGNSTGEFQFMDGTNTYLFRSGPGVTAIPRGNVGIGTTTAVAKLHVGDAGSAPNAMSITGSDAYIRGNLEVDGRIYGDGSQLTNLPAGISGLTATRVPVASSSTTLVDSMIYSVGGNAGIGTTAPGALLDVAGDLRFSGDLIVADQGAVKAMTAVSGTRTAFRVRPPTGGNIADFTFYSSSDLSNSSILSLYSSNGAGGFATGSVIASYNNGTGVLQPLLFVMGNSNTEVMRISTAGNVGIGTNAPVARLAVVGSGTTTGRALEIDDSLYNPKVVVLDNGYVGIGTPLPGALLSVGPANNFSVNATGAFFAGNNSAINGFLNMQNHAIVGVSSLTIGGWTILNSLDNPGGTALGIYASTISASSGSLIMSGNLGIGTTEPLAKFVVVGAGQASARALEIDDSLYNPKVVVLDNGNVGIGTTAPVARFHVANDASAPNAMSITGSDAYIRGNLEVDGRIYGDGSQLTGLPSGISGLTATRVPVASSATTLVDSVIYSIGSNVGIGTTNPRSLLDINGVNGVSVITLNSGTYLQGGWGGNPNIMYIGGNVATGTMYLNNGQIQVGANTAGSSLLQKGSTNNTVEIRGGTPGDAQLFRIYNTYTNATTYERVDMGWQANANVFTIETTGGSGGGVVRDMALMGGNVGIGTSVSAAKLHIGDVGSAPDAMSITGSDVYVQGNLEVDGRIYGDGSGLTGISGAISGLTATRLPVASGSTTIVDSIIYEVGGNIGIGTASAGSKLVVAGDISNIGATGYVLTQGLTTASGNDVISINYNTAGGMDFGSNTGLYFRPAGFGAPDTKLTRNAAGLLEINNGTNGQYRDLQLRAINPSSGNVGIATTFATSKLDVYGNTSNFNTAQFGNFGVQSFTNTNGFVSQNMYWNGTQSIYRQTGAMALFQFIDGDIQFQTAPSGTAGAVATLTVPMMVKNGGNVGIGTVVPVARLDVVGAGTTSATSALIVRDSTKAAKVTVLDNGSVGIGSTAPQTPLDVAGQIRTTGNIQMVTTNTGMFSGSMYTSVIPNATGSVLAINSGGSVRVAIDSDSNSTSQVFQIGVNNYFPGGTPDPLFTVMETGNVGIGTTGPVVKLHVGDGADAPNAMTITGFDAYIKGNLEVDGRIYGDGSGLTGISGAISGLTATRVPVASSSTTLVDSEIYYAGGNVGIGTTPSTVTRLAVQSTASNPTVPVAVFKNSLGTDIVSFTSSGHGAFLNPVNVGSTTYQADYSVAALSILNATSGTVGGVNAGGHFIPTSGTASFTALNYSSNINQTGGANGITRGIYINPNLISAVDFRAIETNTPDGTARWAYYGAGTAAAYFGGNIGIGTNLPVAALSVGPGTPNAMPVAGGDDAYVAGNLEVDGRIYGDGSGLTGLTSSQWTTNGTNIYYNTGNVGIGTSTPTQLLEVVGGIGASGGGDSYFTGSVGIATTAPQNTLDVRGTLNASGAVTFGSVLGVTGNLDVNGATNDIAGTLNLSGNALRSSGALTVTPAAGTNLNIALSGAGDLAVNTDQFYVDTATLNVGVGTSVPMANLHVGGVGSAPNAMSSTGDDLYVLGNIEFDGRIYGDGSGLSGISGAISGLTATRVPVASNSTTIVDSGIYYVGGNVGINTTSPAEKLYVAGGNILFENTYNLRSKMADGTPANVFGVDSSNMLRFGSGGWDSIRFDVGGLGGRMFINNVGNVGISTTAPVSRLHIGAGTPNAMSITGSDAYIAGNLEVDGRIYGDGSGLTGLSGLISGLTTNYVTKATSSTGIGNSQIFDDGTNVGIGTTAPVYGLALHRNDARTSIVNELALANATNADAVNTIQTSPALLFESAGWKTDTTSSVKSYWRMYSQPSTGTSIYNQLFFDFSSDKTSWSNAFWFQQGWLITTIGFVGPVSQVNTITDTGIGSNIDIELKTSGRAIRFGLGYPTMTEWARFDAGNLGIGTAVPSQRLDVNGNISIGAPTPNVTPPIYTIKIPNSAGTAPDVHPSLAIEPGGNSSGSARGGDLRLSGGRGGLNTDASFGDVLFTSPPSATSVVTWMKVEGFSGNVAIGTSTPVARLHVATDASVPNAMPITGSDAYIAGNLEVDGRIYGDGSGLTGLTSSQWTTNGSNIYYNSGNVGIGTSAPVQTLEVAGGIVASGGGDSYFTGSVGIGTAVPLSMLDVEGTLNATGAVTLGSTLGVTGNLDANGGANDIAGTLNLSGNALTSTGALTVTPGAGTNVNIALSGGGDLAVNTSQFYVDTSTTNVGIGTSVALANLHVGGLGSAPNLMPSTGDDLYVRGNIEFDGRIYGDGSGLTGISGAISGLTATRIPVALNSTTIVDSNIYNVSGNVGIGAASPNAPLLITRDTGVSTEGVLLRLDSFNGTSGNGGSILFTNNNNVLQLAKIASSDAGNYGGELVFSTKLADTVAGNPTTERMRITNTGNVGIGTTTPNAYLHVYGANTGRGLLYLQNIGINAGDVNGIDLRHWTDGRLQAYVRDEIFNGWGTKLHFGTAPGVNNAVTRMTITDTGNIGIGTTDPVAKLHIGDAGTPPNAMPITGNDVYVKGNLEVDGKIYGDGSALTGLGSGITGLNAGYIPRASTPTTIVDSTIYQNGSNIGIGTTSSSQKLVVLGNISINSGYLTFWNGDAQIGTADNGSGRDLVFSNYTGSVLTEKMRVLFNGNVGIGTSQPGGLLEVFPSGAGRTRGTLLVNDKDVTVGVLSGTPGDNSKFNVVARGGTTMFMVDTNNAVSYFQNSNVGIGTSDPIYKLDLRGGTYRDQFRLVSSDPLGTGLMLESTDTGGRRFSIISTGTGDYPGAGALSFWDETNGSVPSSVRMVINASGNLGISTTAPVAKLHVGGGVPNAMSITGSDAYVRGNLEVDGRIYGDGSGLTGLSGSISGLTATRIPVASGSTTIVDSIIYQVGGNIGIGSAAPGQELDILGDIRLQNTTSAGTGVIYKGTESFIHNFQHPTGSGVVPTGRNTFVGVNAGNFSMGSTATETWHGSLNTAIGYAALLNNTTGDSNTVNGYFALASNTTGGNNTAEGFMALYANVSGGANTATGHSALISNVNGGSNVAYGYHTLLYNVAGSLNTVIGMEAGGAGVGTTTNADMWNNVAVGFQAGYMLGLGNNNTLLGYKAGDNITTGDNNIVLGYDIEAPSATSANTLNIGNLIFGTGLDGAGTIISTGNVAIGTNAPRARLHVASDAAVPNAMPITGSDLYVRGNIELDGRIYGDGSGLTGLSGAISGLTATRLPVASGSTTIIDSSVYQVGGNIGINTAAPSARLDILGIGTTSTTPSLVIRDANKVQTVTVLDNGNVGVGAAQPVYDLEVEGTFKAGVTGNSRTFVIDSTGRATLLYNDDALYPQLTILNPEGNAASGNQIRFRLGYAGTPVDSGYLQNAHEQAWTSTATTQDAYMSFATALDGVTAEKLRINSSGNIGIATTAPVAKLHVGGGVPDAMPITGSDVYIRGNLEVDGRIYGDGSGLTGISSSQWTTTDNDVSYSTGNVGIGTTVPVQKLEVKGGNLYINQTSGLLIMKKPDGTCAACGPNNSDIWVCTGVACP